MFLVMCCLVSFGKGSKKHNNEMISIALRHTGCFGRCPDYSIEVHRNGTITYTGRMFVLDSGVYTKKVGTKKTLPIIEQAEAFRLDTCKDRYESLVPDLPGIVYTIKYKSTTKMILNANFGPAVLGELREKIDGLVKFKAAEPGTLGHLEGAWHKTAGGHK